MFSALPASLRWMPWCVVFVAALATACVAEEEKATKDADLYTVPDTEDPAELVKFIEKIFAFRPNSQQQAREHNEKAPPIVHQAATRILELDKEGKSDAATFAKRVLLQMRLMKIGDSTQEEQTQLVDDLVAYLKSQEKLERMDLGIAVRLGDVLDQLGHPEALRANQTFGELLAKNEDEDVAHVGNMMLGVARRLDLVGHEMDLTGTKIDGSEFNLADLKGKVVLVDFWATWCGPCVAEIPNVKKHYEAYHDKGFEVVGISLDQDRPELEKFIKEKEVPWTILHQNDGTGNHPAAELYGITAIPFMALVDREGKVISTHARGTELDKLLEEQFKDQQ